MGRERLTSIQQIHSIYKQHDPPLPPGSDRLPPTAETLREKEIERVRENNQLLTWCSHITCSHFSHSRLHVIAEETADPVFIAVKGDSTSALYSTPGSAESLEERNLTWVDKVNSVGEEVYLLDHLGEDMVEEMDKDDWFWAS